MQTSDLKIKHLRKLTHTTTLVGFLFRITNGAQAVLAALIANHYLHMGETSIGLFVSVGSLTSLIIMGLLSFDLKIYRHAMFLSSSLALGLMFIFISGVDFYLSKSRELFLTGMLLLNIGNALIIPAIVTVVGMIGYKSIEKQFGTYTSALSLALFLSPSIEGVILALSNQNLRIAILVAAFPALVATFAIILNLKNIQDVAISNADRLISVTEHKPFNFFKNRSCLKALTLLLMFEVPFEAVTIFGGLMGNKVEHLNYSSIAIAFSVLFFISLICRLTFAATNHLNKVQLLIVVSIASALISLAGFDFNSSVIFYISMAIFGIGHGIIYPLALSVIRKTIPMVFVRQANSTLSTINQLSAVIVPFGMGFEITKIGFQKSFLSIGIIVVAFGALALGLKAKNSNVTGEVV